MEFGSPKIVEFLVLNYKADPKITVHCAYGPEDTKEWCKKYLDAKTINEKISSELSHSSQRKAGNRPKV